MARARKRRLAVTRDDQREALTSTVRQEILEHLLVTGPATVASVAARMGRSPHSLYYHVRQLLDADLIAQVGSRRSGRRDQATYDVVAEVFETPGRPGSSRDLSWTLKTIGAAFRRAEREFRAALESDTVDFTGSDWFVGRLRTRMSRTARAEAMRHLRAIQRIFAQELRAAHDPRARLETCSFTAAFIPSRTTRSAG